MPGRIGRIKWYVAAACVAAVAASSSAVALAQTQSGPSLSSSHSGSGPGTVSGPNGQFAPGNGTAPPIPPGGSTSYGQAGSGSGKTTVSNP